MKLNITYRHLASTPSIEERITEKVAHFVKYFNESVEINWVCSIDNGLHRSEVNVHAGQQYFHAKAEEDNLYKTIDRVLAKLERQIRKKNKIHTQNKSQLEDLAMSIQ